ncbi:MAG: hypothetical protein ACK4P5_10140, partial [Fimbriimonadales bacterium]
HHQQRAVSVAIEVGYQPSEATVTTSVIIGLAKGACLARGRIVSNDAQPQQRPHYSGSLRLGVQF